MDTVLEENFEGKYPSPSSCFPGNLKKFKVQQEPFKYATKFRKNPKQRF